MDYPVIDLHCDLLSYLAKDQSNRSIWDPDPRCSFPQLQKGNVKLQTMAIFSETAPFSLENGLRQLEILQNLFRLHHDQFFAFEQGFEQEKIAVIASFENASAFCLEEEPIDEVLVRFERIQQSLKKVFYVSLTWNEENRFGGGASTKVGLKQDGKIFLNFLSNRGVAIDLSHTSDLLANDILDHVDRNGLIIPVLASHSNFRSVYPHERNLTDSIAKEIIARGGLIGLVLYKKFVHPHDPKAIARHIEYGLTLGGQHALCLGSDYFCVEDFLDHPKIAQDVTKMGFFELYSDASKYQNLFDFFKKECSFNANFLNQLSHQNALNFLKKTIDLFRNSLKQFQVVNPSD